jgi:hypothetical protein
MSLLGIEVGDNPRTLPNFNRTTFDKLTCLSTGRVIIRKVMGGGRPVNMAAFVHQIKPILGHGTPRSTKEFLGHHTDAEGGS